MHLMVHHRKSEVCKALLEASDGSTELRKLQ